MLCMLLRKMCILLLMDTVFYKFLLGPFGLMYQVHCFLVDDLFIALGRLLKSPAVTVFSTFSFISGNIYLIYLGTCNVVCITIYSCYVLLESQQTKFMRGEGESCPSARPAIMSASCAPVFGKRPLPLHGWGTGYWAPSPSLSVAGAQDAGLLSSGVTTSPVSHAQPLTRSLSVCIARAQDAGPLAPPSVWPGHRTLDSDHEGRP